MTVKEALAMLEKPKAVRIGWDGSLIEFNFKNKIEVDVWGDFVIEKICASAEDVFELDLAARPVKAEVRV